MLVTLVNLTSFSQEKYTLSGIISDTKNNETLIGASIYLTGTNYSTVTNEYGFYSLTIPKGDYQFTISYVGYQLVSENISLTKNLKKNFSLAETGEQLEEVIITEKTKTDVRKPEMSVHKLSIATIKQMPVVLGEVDIIKSILFLPGVVLQR